MIHSLGIVEKELVLIQGINRERRQEVESVPAGCWRGCVKVQCIDGRFCCNLDQNTYYPTRLGSTPP